VGNHGTSGVGVALTNCDTCRFDTMMTTARGKRVRGCCAVPMSVLSWQADHRDLTTGNPKPGATGCPGWAKRGEG
jgi:hypothetical protein